MSPSSEKERLQAVNNENLPLINNSPQLSNDLKTKSVSINYGSDNCNDLTIFSKSKRDELVSSLRRGLSDFINHHTGSIGWLGSMSIAVNSLTGPAMLNLPATFQRSGLIPTLATLLFVCVLSALCSLHMANTISKVPGNEKFERHIEYSEAFRRFWGDRWFVFTQIAFFGCITCLNISSIVDTARVMDTFLGHWLPGGGSAALQFTTDKSWSIELVRWTYSDCSQRRLVEGKCHPFLHRKEGVLLTLGYVITTLLLLPLALMDLKENVLWQVVGFLVLLVISLQFAVTFALSESFNFENLTLWGDTWGSLFGVILFNFCLVIAIPAWLYEKEPHVPVPSLIHASSGLSAFLYVAVGILGACSLPNVSENMLESMLSGSMGKITQLGASVFAFAIIGFGVPLFSVLTRLNLTGSGTCSERVGNLLAVYLPFGISWMMYHRVTELLSWGGIIFTSFVAFILPLLLAWHTVQEFDSPGSIHVGEGFGGSRRKQTTALAMLFALAVISVVVGIFGIVSGR